MKNLFIITLIIIGFSSNAQNKSIQKTTQTPKNDSLQILKPKKNKDKECPCCRAWVSGDVNGHIGKCCSEPNATKMPKN